MRRGGARRGEANQGSIAPLGTEYTPSRPRGGAKLFDIFSARQVSFPRPLKPSLVYDHVSFCNVLHNANLAS